jgi:hypothetical protein
MEKEKVENKKKLGEDKNKKRKRRKIKRRML